MNVGVLGGGQLGRMLAHAGIPLGISCHFYDPDAPTATACFSGGAYTAYNNYPALASFVAEHHVMTLEWENVPLDTLNFVATKGSFYPQPKGVAVCQDRLAEKRNAQKLGIGTTGFAPVNSVADLQAATEKLGLPGILKTRRLGYDGKGQWRINQPADLAALPNAVWEHELIYESFVPFVAELSMISVRQKSGAIAFYPLIYNVHRHGVLAYSIACHEPWLKQLQPTAESYAEAILQDLQYVGVLVLEFFVTQDGTLLLNEMAPRVHNSGHLTINAAATSQFENHLRAILDWDLGPTTITRPAVMVNQLGAIPESYRTTRLEDVFVHDYGKAPKPGRKVGHITILGDTLESVIAKAKMFDPTLHYLPPHLTPQRG